MNKDNERQDYDMYDPSTLSTNKVHLYTAVIIGIPELGNYDLLKNIESGVWKSLLQRL